MTSNRQLNAAYALAQDYIVEGLTALLGERGFVVSERRVNTGKGVATTWRRPRDFGVDNIQLHFRWKVPEFRSIDLSISFAVPRQDGRLIDLDGQNVFWLVRKETFGPSITEAAALRGPEAVRPVVEILRKDILRAIRWWDRHYSSEEGVLGRLRADDRNGFGMASEPGREILARFESALARKGVDRSSVKAAPIRRKSKEEKAWEGTILRWLETGGALFPSRKPASRVGPRPRRSRRKGTN